MGDVASGSDHDVSGTGIGPAGLDAAFHVIIETSPYLYAILDEQICFRYVNAAALEIIGYEPAELIGMSAADVIDPEDFELALGALGQLVDEFDAHPGEGIPMGVRLIRKDGSVVHVEIGAIPRFDDPDVNGVIIRGRPMSGQQMLDQALEALVASCPLDEVLEYLVTSVEHELRGVRASIGYGWDGTSFTSVVGHHLPAALGGTADSDHTGLASAGVNTPWAMALASHDTAVYPSVAALPESMQDAAVAAGLSACWAVPVAVPPDDAQLACITVWRTIDGPPFVSHLVALDRARRLTSLAFERRHTEELLRHAALHDTLTGIANRAQFFLRLEAGTTTFSEQLLAVLYLDLDGFKNVNDTYGHAAGDQLLRVATDRITASVRPNDLVARLGGDEFAVLCSSVSNAAEAEAIAERLIETVAQPIDVGEHHVEVGVSIGIAVARANSTAGTELLDAADAALYEAKRAGKGTWRMAGGAVVLE